MSAFSDDMETSLLNHVFRNTDYTRPGTIFVGLHTADPADAGTAYEVSGNAYARMPVVTGASSEWDAPSGGTVKNTGTIEFAAASGGDWGTISHLSLWDALTTGTALFHGALTASKVITDGDVFRIAPNGLSISFD